MIASNLPSPSRVVEAIAHWNTKLAGTLSLIPKRSTDTAYVVFRPGSGCRSNIGRTGDVQYIDLSTACSRGKVIHEIGHALGVYHEQGRLDRDSYVKVLWENISTGASYNFNPAASSLTLGGYDYGSILHYGSTAFSKNRLPTLQPLRPLPTGVVLGQRNGLSDNDVAMMRSLYQLAAQSTTRPTFYVRPVGGTYRVGSYIMLSAAASGSAPMQYQWRRQDTSTIPNALSSTFVIPSAKATDQAIYMAVAKNLVASVASSPASIVVLTAPNTKNVTSFKVRARGIPSGGVYPRLELVHAGAVLGSRTLTGTMTTYSFTPTSPRPMAPLHLRFANDYNTATEDRRIYVEYIERNGVRHHTQAPDVYRRSSSAVCASGYARSQLLACNGTLEFPTAL